MLCITTVSSLLQAESVLIQDHNFDTVQVVVILHIAVKHTYAACLKRSFSPTSCSRQFKLFLHSIVTMFWTSDPSTCSSGMHSRSDDGVLLFLMVFL